MIIITICYIDFLYVRITTISYTRPYDEVRINVIHFTTDYTGRMDCSRPSALYNLTNLFNNPPPTLRVEVFIHAAITIKNFFGIAYPPLLITEYSFTWLRELEHRRVTKLSKVPSNSTGCEPRVFWLKTAPFHITRCQNYFRHTVLCD